MARSKYEKLDTEFLEKCPVCNEGYMLNTMGNWYQCNKCGAEAEKDDYGCLVFDSSVKFYNAE